MSEDSSGTISTAKVDMQLNKEKNMNKKTSRN